MRRRPNEVEFNFIERTYGCLPPLFRAENDRFATAKQQRLCAPFVTIRFSRPLLGFTNAPQAAAFLAIFPLKAGNRRQIAV